METQEKEIATQVNPFVAFYSTAANMIIQARKGRRVFEDGESKVIDPLIIEFNPQRDGFGRFVTDDPESIEYLRKRMATLGDVVDTEEYNRRITPVEIRERMLKDENKRLIEDRNRLLEELEKAGKLRPQK